VPGTTAEGLTPRIAETAFTLWKIYAALTALEIVILIALGMSSFDAVCHSFTTMSTGGFSTRDESIAYWDSAAIDIVVSIFMIVAGINFGLYYGAIRGLRLRVILSNPEFKVFIGCVVIATSVITIAILPLHEWDLFQAFRYAFFQVGTFITSTGYVTDDYMAYPGWVVAMILMIMFMGGCAGSTAGGMKVERIMLMAKQAWAQVHRFFRPNVVKVVRMGKRPVAEPILADVAAFFMVYIVFTGVATLAMSAADDLPVPTAFGATLSAVSNMGPAPFYQEADNFASYGVTTRLVGVAAMLLGRLEFFTLLALVVPAFWRR
jgi:trk system potassium uptake protein TrkH